MDGFLSSLRSKLTKRFVAVLCIGGALYASSAIANPAVKGDAARPEVGKPLEAAQALLKAQKPQEALAKIKQAESVANKNDYEAYIIHRVRIQAALGAGDIDGAAKSFEHAAASGRMTAAEKLAVQQALATAYYKARNYVKAAQWAQRYATDGGTDAGMRTLLMQSYYLDGAFAKAASVAQAEIQNARKNGRVPAEEQLQLLANAALKQNDHAGWVAAFETLLTYYPKREYWAHALQRTETHSGLSDRLLLDLYRLKLATGAGTTPADYVEATQLALRDGSAQEARAIIESGFSSGVLGKGKEADRHMRLRNLAQQSAAESSKTLNDEIAKALSAQDGEVMLNVGLEALANGRVDEGLRLMERGVHTDRLKASREARLRLGIAYLRANQPDKAIKTFDSIGNGNDATATMSRLWRIYALQSGKKGHAG